MAIVFQRWNGNEWVTESEGGGGGVSNHASLTNLAWALSKHEGTPDTVAAFDESGEPALVDLDSRIIEVGMAALA